MTPTLSWRDTCTELATRGSESATRGSESCFAVECVESFTETVGSLRNPETRRTPSYTYRRYISTCVWLNWINIYTKKQFCYLLHMLFISYNITMYSELSIQQYIVHSTQYWVHSTLKWTEHTIIARVHCKLKCFEYTISYCTLYLMSIRWRRVCPERICPKRFVSFAWRDLYHLPEEFCIICLKRFVSFARRDLYHLSKGNVTIARRDCLICPKQSFARRN